MAKVGVNLDDDLDGDDSSQKFQPPSPDALSGQ